MSAIQRVPAGLLELLGLKGGVTPKQSAEFLQPTIDSVDFYGAALWGRVFNALPAAVVTNSVVVTVPVNEVWILRWCSALITVAVGVTSVALQLEVSPSGQGGVVAYKDDFYLAGVPAGTSSPRVCWSAPTTTVLPPGSTIGARLMELQGAANGTLVVESSHYRLPL